MNKNLTWKPLTWKPKCAHCGVESVPHWTINYCNHCRYIFKLINDIHKNGRIAAQKRSEEKRLVKQIVVAINGSETSNHDSALVKSLFKFLSLIHFNRINQYRDDNSKIAFDIVGCYNSALLFLGEEPKNQWTEDDVIETILRVLNKMK